ncbi:MAG: Crp/Fnr family transcriptional regulator, partial [Chloroflexota bacterium]|nr:Crp/Fnr family transcriptional regulator [Chloroflexota bacterium]
MADLWLFRDLSAEQRRAVQSQAHRRELRSGDVLFREAESCSAVHFVAAGRLKLSKLGENGREVTLGFLGSGEVLGEESFLSGEEYSFSAAAAEDSLVCSCEKEDFQRFLLASPELALKVVSAFASRLSNLSDQLADMALYQVRGRVAATLLRLGSSYGVPTRAGLALSFALTHDDLASLVGASRVMVTNVLAALREAGCITVERHRVTLVDPA